MWGFGCVSTPSHPNNCCDWDVYSYLQLAGNFYSAEGEARLSFEKVSGSVCTHKGP
jgi:hypothetical protein